MELCHILVVPDKPGTRCRRPLQLELRVSVACAGFVYTIMWDGSAHAARPFRSPVDVVDPWFCQSWLGSSQRREGKPGWGVWNRLRRGLAGRLIS
ncbi:hypothetical protein BDV06DRAFT_192683 [Aspergillus oleicola]